MITSSTPSPARIMTRQSSRSARSSRGAQNLQQPSRSAVRARVRQHQCGLPGPAARRTPLAGAAGSPAAFAVPGFAAARNAAATGYQGIMDASAASGHDPGFAEHLTSEDLRLLRSAAGGPGDRGLGALLGGPPRFG